MLLELPKLATAASDEALVTLLQRCEVIASHDRHVLATMGFSADAAARECAMELETLLGTMMSRLPDWSAGDGRDVELSDIARTAISLAIPAIERSIRLARCLRYDTEAQSLACLRHELANLDDEFEDFEHHCIAGR